MNQKLKDTISLEDAMANLAAIASIELNNLSPLGIVKKHRLITTQEEFGSHTVEWVSSEGPESILDILDLTYRAIHLYLLKHSENTEMNGENKRVQRGIAAMMAQVGESASKLETYLKLRMGKNLDQPIADREEFKILQKFYTQQFLPKFSSVSEGEEGWSNQDQENRESSLLYLSKAGLKDFEAVRRDEDYELFTIRNEEGKPYFNPELLKHIKLTCDFDPNSDSFEEDPLLKVRAMQDRDLHASAAQILSECHPMIAEFYHLSRKYEENELCQSLGMGLIALYIAANPRYLLQNTTGKSCLQYFDDFHRFLRRAMRTAEYQKLIAYPPDKTDKASHLFLQLTHALSRSFFERAGGVKLESIGLIHRAMRKGEEIKQKEHQHLLKGETVWSQFQLEDETYRTLLSQFPNGPLFRILDLIREEVGVDTTPSFDPIGQENLPSRVFEVRIKNKKTDVLRMAAPIRQSFINKAEIIDEFRGFLRAFAQDRRTHLLINLQDRTSWKEYARVRALETLQMNAEFNHQLYVLTLPKHTDFYYQINEYLNLNQAEDFIRAFQEQLASPEECGYFFPSQMKKGEIENFAQAILPLIHKVFFHQKNTLTRRNREDFIEIFYQFLILKCIELLEPNSMSFTCKDGIDTGAAQQATFYTFIQLLTGHFHSNEEKDLFRWLMYTPALFIRERAIDPDRFNRAISALERIDGEAVEKQKHILSTFEPLFEAQTISSLRGR